MPFVALEGSSKMQVLRVKAARAVRAFAEAIPDIDEVDARNLERCCDLLMTDEELLQRNGPWSSTGQCELQRRNAVLGSCSEGHFRSFRRHFGRAITCEAFKLEGGKDDLHSALW